MRAVSNTNVSLTVKMVFFFAEIEKCPLISECRTSIFVHKVSLTSPKQQWKTHSDCCTDSYASRHTSFLENKNGLISSRKLQNFCSRRLRCTLHIFAVLRQIVVWSGSLSFQSACNQYRFHLSIQYLHSNTAELEWHCFSPGVSQILTLPEIPIFADRNQNLKLDFETIKKPLLLFDSSDPEVPA